MRCRVRRLVAVSSGELVECLEYPLSALVVAAALRAAQSSRRTIDRRLRGEQATASGCALLLASSPALLLKTPRPEAEAFSIERS
jgi:hypothetical protein